MVGIFSFVLPSISYLLGKELINSAIKDTASATYGILHKFIEHPDIYEILKKLDTKAMIERVESTIQTISIEDNNVPERENPIYLVLNQIHQKMCEIMDNLSKIKHYADLDKKRWFSNIRKSSYKGFLCELESNHEILDKRLNYLFQLLKIQSNIKIKKIPLNVLKDMEL